ncbi:MAG: hypothetical protein IPH75_04345 [bacterium]|nr:hypothetical protein [bacterium]
MNRVLLVISTVFVFMATIRSDEVQGQAIDASTVPSSSRDSLSTASALFGKGDYLTAYWYCFHLFGDIPQEVTDLICRRRHEVGNIPLEIKTTYESMCSRKMAVDTVDRDELTLGTEQLVSVGLLVDSLIFVIERELISRYFPDAFAADLMKDFVMVDSTIMEDQMAWIVEQNSENGVGNHRRLNFRSRDGLAVKGFEGSLYDRVQIDIVTADSQSTISSLAAAVLDSKGIRLPLVGGPNSYAKSPPCVMIESAGVLVMISEHCENYYRSDGSMEEDVFWSKAAHWVSLIAGVHPISILAWNCGGPVREMN